MPVVSLFPVSGPLDRKLSGWRAGVALNKDGCFSDFPFMWCTYNTAILHCVNGNILYIPCRCFVSSFLSQSLADIVVITGSAWTHFVLDFHIRRILKN